MCTHNLLAINGSMLKAFVDSARILALPWKGHLERSSPVFMASRGAVNARGSVRKRLCFSDPRSNMK
jgi:hypothetical protein